MVTKWFDERSAMKEPKPDYPMCHEYVTLADHQAVVAEKDRAINFHKSSAEVANLRRDEMARVLSLKEKEVAEKDKEIGRLKKQAECLGILLLADNKTELTITNDKAYHELMQQAVRFAEYLLQGHRHRLKVLRFTKLRQGIVEADAFLARPDVVAWRKQEEA